MPLKTALGPHPTLVPPSFHAGSWPTGWELTGEVFHLPAGSPAEGDPVELVIVFWCQNHWEAFITMILTPFGDISRCSPVPKIGTPSPLTLF